jgi:hypothetical protein
MVLIGSALVLPGTVHMFRMASSPWTTRHLMYGRYADAVVLLVVIGALVVVSRLSAVRPRRLAMAAVLSASVSAGLTGLVVFRPEGVRVNNLGAAWYDYLATPCHTPQWALVCFAALMALVVVLGSQLGLSRVLAVLLVVLLNIGGMLYVGSRHKVVETLRLEGYEQLETVRDQGGRVIFGDCQYDRTAVSLWYQAQYCLWYETFGFKQVGSVNPERDYFLGNGALIRAGDLDPSPGGRPIVSVRDARIVAPCP